MRPFLLLIIATVIASPIFAQKPERQISFARESKPHSYYVEQAELWAKQLAKDSTSEDSWYNYFRACRNSYGTSNWKSDFVNESPYLKTQEDILEAMKVRIPESFTYNYLMYLSGGIIPSLAPYLLKAYAMNPDFEGISSSMISYAISVSNDSLRKEVNKHWYPKNEIASGLMNYGYNVLNSVEPNAILFVQADNDTYPLHLLQDVLGIRTDVKVINIDFLLLDSYRQHVFGELGIQDIPINADPNIYQENWQKVLTQVLAGYKQERPVYIGMTVQPDYYKEFEKDLIVSGLTYRYSKKSLDLVAWNNKLYDSFLLDDVKHPLVIEQNQGSVDMINLNYIEFLKTIYVDSIKHNKMERAKEAKDLAIKVVERLSNSEWNEQVRKEFE